MAWRIPSAGCWQNENQGYAIMILRFQDKLIFHPVKPNLLTYSAYAPLELWLSRQKVSLHGWKIEQSNSCSEAVLLYFGGNAEDVTLNFSQVSEWNVRRAYFFNYRGYGWSQGKPSQAAFFEDALAIYDFLVDAQGEKPENIILMGRSLGSAVATYVAAQRWVSRSILITPFDSVLSLAKQMLPFLPVRWLLRHPFPSSDYAPSIRSNLLMILAEHDEVISRSNSLVLYEKWAGNKRLCTIAKAGHNDLHLAPKFSGEIREFVANVGARNKEISGQAPSKENR